MINLNKNKFIISFCLKSTMDQDELREFTTKTFKEDEIKNLRVFIMKPDKNEDKNE